MMKSSVRQMKRVTATLQRLWQRVYRAQARSSGTHHWQDGKTCAACGQMWPCQVAEWEEHGVGLRAQVARLEGEKAAMAAALETMEPLLQSFDNWCRVDHRGQCQSHLLDKPCSVAAARRAFTAALSGEPKGCPKCAVLTAKLEQYGQHEDGCQGTAWGCTCGLAAAKGE